MRQIVLDTETTGLSPDDGHRIIEIGCLELINRRLTKNSLHFYINPQRSIEQAAIEVHGITEAFLQDKPLFQDIAQELVDYLTGAELIIHNAPFDVGFINHELALAGKQKIRLDFICTIVDTLVLARRKHPGQKNNLDALCRRYHVDNSNREYHGALLDAELLSKVYLLMTGGQSQLFDSELDSAISSAKKKNVRRVDKSRPKLTIIEPSAEELRAHQKFEAYLESKEK